MLSVDILCVGSCKERYWREACGEYQKRLQSFCRLRMIEVDEFRLPDAPSPAQIEQGLKKEADAILSKVPSGAVLIPLCIEGKMLDSPGLAQELERRAVAGSSCFVFVIGGSFGLHENVKHRAQLSLSLSRMTFPHQLTRVLLLEQVYRALNLRAGGKYHK